MVVDEWMEQTDDRTKERVLSAEVLSLERQRRLWMLRSGGGLSPSPSALPAATADSDRRRVPAGAAGGSGNGPLPQVNALRGAG